MILAIMARLQIQSRGKLRITLDVEIRRGYRMYRLGTLIVDYIE